MILRPESQFSLEIVLIHHLFLLRIFSSFGFSDTNLSWFFPPICLTTSSQICTEYSSSPFPLNVEFNSFSQTSHFFLWWTHPVYHHWVILSTFSYLYSYLYTEASSCQIWTSNTDFVAKPYSHVQAYLRDIVDLVPDQYNKANIPIKWITNLRVFQCIYKLCLYHYVVY